MKDLIAGAESDSGLRLEMDCPTCGCRHRVALSRLDGRFALECGRGIISGQVTDWQEWKPAKKEAPGVHTTDG